MREIEQKCVQRKPGGEGESAAVPSRALVGLSLEPCLRGAPVCRKRSGRLCVSCWARSVLRAPLWTARRIGR